MILRNGKIIGETVYYQKTQYQVIINFDYASKMWRQNKVYVGEGMFRYKRIRQK